MDRVCVFLEVASLLCVSPVVFRKFVLISQCLSAELFEFHHCFEFQCSARQAQHAHAVFTRMSEHGPPNPQFFSTLITSPSAANFFYFLEPLGTGQPCAICQDKTHLMEFPLRVGTGARCVRAEGSRSLT